MRKKGAPGVTTAESEVYVWDGEESCSVTATPFSWPVRPVFVVSDVSIKASESTPFPANGLPPRPPCSAGSNAAFQPRPCPRLLLSFSPSLQAHTYTPQGLIVPGGHTPDIRVEKKELRQM